MHSQLGSNDQTGLVMRSSFDHQNKKQKNTFSSADQDVPTEKARGPEGLLPQEVSPKENVLMVKIPLEASALANPKITRALLEGSLPPADKRTISDLLEKDLVSFVDDLCIQMTKKSNVPDEQYDENQKPNLPTEDDIVESDIDLDETEVVEPDSDPPQKMGDPTVEVTEENHDTAQMSKSKAMNAISEGKLDEAIEHLTEAILLNPRSAILYATRAGVFVKMSKPNAAFRDADAALQINPNSAKGYKFRGIAQAMLGQWEESARDLHTAANLDYDEEMGTMLKKVEPNARKIEEHRRKYERLRKEKELRKAERGTNQRAEAQTTYERQKKKEHSPRNRTSSSEAASALKDGHVLSIHSSSEFESKLKAASKLSHLVILYFTATWCGPCRFMSPLYESLAAKYPKTVFMKVDIDELRDVAARWNISSVPTFFFVKDGKEVDKVIGADKSGLEKKIVQYAGQS